MPNLRIKSSGLWDVQPLASDLVLLGADPAGFARARQTGESLSGRVVLRRTIDSDGGENWLLFAPPRAVWVNGRPLLTGAHLLRHKDELRLPRAAPLYFSTEELARVAAFPGGARPAHCPRCRQVIEAEAPAVQCPNPGCRMWHHQTAGCECWTYAATCAVCDQATTLDSGYRWIPEAIGP